MCFSPIAVAQFNASVSGTVEDNTGAVIFGASITLTNPSTQATQTTTSNSSGFYRFSELPPGSYTVSITASNFKPETLNDVIVSAEAPRVVDVKLQLGGTSQTVTVNGNALSALQTGDLLLPERILFSFASRQTSSTSSTRPTCSHYRSAAQRQISAILCLVSLPEQTVVE